MKNATNRAERRSRSARSSAEYDSLQAAIGGGLDPELADPLGTDALAVQMTGATGERDAKQVHEVAAAGLAGTGRELPHLDQIQQSFGRHDVTSVEAHVAPEATARLGATAYASGNQMAFDSDSPSLHTVAHEAAHVVQQRDGVSLTGGVGRSGDVYERHADAVAEQVTQGRSAEKLLDAQGAGAGSGVQRSVAVQRKDKKEVSSTAMTRLTYAKAAIDHTKAVMTYGAGNQWAALNATNFNSYFRMKVMRDEKYWKWLDSLSTAGKQALTRLAKNNRDSYTAAKAKIAHGGNCGEHAAVAYDYLLGNASGEVIARANKSGLDHAFVLIGPLRDPDSDLVVADPWPTNPTATIWEDHFAYTSDRKQLKTRRSHLTSGRGSISDILAASLELTDEGQKLSETSLTKKETADTLKRTKGIWDHPDAAAEDHDFDYEEK